MTKARLLIAFVVYPGVTALDFVGPLTVLRGIGSPYRCAVVGADYELIATDAGVRLAPTLTFDEVPEVFALFVPGANRHEDVAAAMQDESILNFVRRTASQAKIAGAIGSGSLILAAAGLLRGRVAATHRAFTEQLEMRGVEYSDKRWVEDGNLLTSAGGSAGIDMMLALYSRLKSLSAAKWTQLVIEYDPEPPFGPLSRRVVATPAAAQMELS